MYPHSMFLSKNKKNNKKNLMNFYDYKNLWILHGYVFVMGISMMIIFEYVDVVYMYVHLVHMFCLVRNGLFFTQSSKKKKKKKKLYTELRTDFVLFITILTYFKMMSIYDF